MKNQQFFNFFWKNNYDVLKMRFKYRSKNWGKKNSSLKSLTPQSLKKTIELLKNQQFFKFFLEKEIRCFEDEIQVYVEELKKKKLKPQKP